MDISLELAISPLLEALEQNLKELSSQLQGQKVWEAARYALFNGGKRIRPLIVLAILEDISGNYEKGLTAASALEMIHTYSLIHDDLPAMDNDDYRRGLPTVHRKFDEATAILAGDLLLTLAFETLSHSSELTDLEKVKAIQMVSQKSGGAGLVLGQMMDIENSNHAALDLCQIHQKKTGSLFEAAFGLGAMLAGLPPNQIELFQNNGKKLGLAFQIIDDLLDVVAPQKKRGSSDEKNKKRTFVHLYGMEKSKTWANELLEESLDSLQENGRCSILSSICKTIVNRKV